MPHIHFIGIGGARMSALARVMLARGDEVSGSDPQPNAATMRLSELGATVFAAQLAENVQHRLPDLVVTTDAIGPDNPELVAAKSAGVDIVPGAQVLARLMEETPSPRIAIAGTHGKTTTTSMTASVLLAGEMDPTIFIGADYAPIGGNVRIGQGCGFLTEACEAYRSFLHLRPDIAVITNVDHDHTDCYATPDAIEATFGEFVLGMPQDGVVIYCRDDAGAARVAARAVATGLRTRPMGYGIGVSGVTAGVSDLRAEAESTCDAGPYRVTVRKPDGAQEQLGVLQLSIPGAHNVRNALAAAAVGLEVGIPFSAIAGALAAFRGAERRFEVLGEARGVCVVDDYAHHPTAIRATVAAARVAYPGRRLVVAFQPHLYSRTRDFLPQFAEALAEADAIVLTDIYAAREEPIPGVRVPDVVRCIAQIAPERTVLYVPSRHDVPGALERISHPGDVVIVMGAGNIRPAGEALLASLQR